MTATWKRSVREDSDLHAAASAGLHWPTDAGVKITLERIL